MARYTTLLACLFAALLMAAPAVYARDDDHRRHDAHRHHEDKGIRMSEGERSLKGRRFRSDSDDDRRHQYRRHKDRDHHSRGHRRRQVIIVPQRYRREDVIGHRTYHNWTKDPKSPYRHPESHRYHRGH